MLFHLFVFCSHMNWSIHSYLDGKLTITLSYVTVMLIDSHARFTAMSLIIRTKLNYHLLSGIQILWNTLISDFSRKRGGCSDN